MGALARRRSRVCVHSAARATSSTPVTASPVSRTLHPLIVSTARMRQRVCGRIALCGTSALPIRRQTAVGILGLDVGAEGLFNLSRELVIAEEAVARL